ncbi:hypothetical protein AB4160_13135 [Shewanella sp. 10N.286.51.B8]|uniref:hypothetical protein n=1 Tax=Shewanella sp. 10N.286.51.B8 TaxID=3229708 RepID=UPI0035510989
MSNRFNGLIPADIIHFYQRGGGTCAEEDELLWVIDHWPDSMMPASEQSAYQREVTSDEINYLRKIIKTIPTGRQKKLRNALNDLLCYLSDALHWQVPPEVVNQLKDKDLQWFEQLNQFAHQAGMLQDGYEAIRTQYIKVRPAVSSEFTALVIGLEVAPLSIEYLAHVLNEPSSIKQEGTSLYLDITHLAKKSKLQQKQHFTRYHLPLFVYRVLQDYYATTFANDKHSTLYHKNKKVTASQLVRKLNLYTPVTPFSLPELNAQKWHLRLQSVWLYRDNIVPSFLKDIRDPERHVAFNKPIIKTKEKHLALTAIYQKDWNENWFEGLSSKAKVNRWPHKTLRKTSLNSSQKPAPVPEWNPHNILPAMLFHYKADLIKYGGVIKETLSDDTINAYTNIEQVFEDNPLPYEKTLDSDALHLWAHTVYDSLSNEGHQKYVHYLFRFMSHHPLTENLDISEFDPPTSTPSVDPNYLTLAELDEVINALLTQDTGEMMQRLFCAVACIIGYFAMLRRGEVLRLRIQDIFCYSTDKQQFHFDIRETTEGSTKNKSARMVHVVIPEEYACLVRMVIDIKQSASVNEPLIGFADEKMHSRQLHYLLPITRAIKAVAGEDVRFHHLRHSGIYLFMQQALHLAYEISPNETTDESYLPRLLSPSAIAKRFHYWVKAKHFSQYNDNLLLSEICQQIGHKYYSTTRWSYLHGIDWLYPFYRYGFGERQQREFNHNELKYLLRLSPTSNDLSRQLSLINTDYRDKMPSQKQQDAILLTEVTLKNWLFKTSQKSTLSIPAVQDLPPSDFDGIASTDLASLWQVSCDTSSSGHFLNDLLKQVRLGELNWKTFSLIWQRSGKHTYQPLTKKQKTALSLLPTFVLDSNNQTEFRLHIILACNSKNAQLITRVFRTHQWHWLSLDFELVCNRKTNIQRQEALLKEQFMIKGDTYRCIKQSTGNSHLIITFKLKLNTKNKAKSQPSLDRGIYQHLHQFLTNFQSLQ